MTLSYAPLLVALAVVTTYSQQDGENWERNREYFVDRDKLYITDTTKTHVPARAFINETSITVSTFRVYRSHGMFDEVHRPHLVYPAWYCNTQEL